MRDEIKAIMEFIEENYKASSRISIITSDLDDGEFSSVVEIRFDQLGFVVSIDVDSIRTLAAMCDWATVCEELDHVITESMLNYYCYR